MVRTYSTLVIYKVCDEEAILLPSSSRLFVDQAFLLTQGYRPTYHECAILSLSLLSLRLQSFGFRFIRQYNIDRSMDGQLA